jgi:hypothetical protein
MQINAATATVPTTRVAQQGKHLRAGWIVTAIPVLFLTFDTTIHLLNITPVVESFVRLGYPAGIGSGLGLIELVCLAAYLVPRTAIVGAILLTGWLGGAIATHLRVGDPLFTHILFPLYVALLLWGGLYLRDARLRQMLQAL